MFVYKICKSRGKYSCILNSVCINLYITYNKKMIFFYLRILISALSNDVNTICDATSSTLVARRDNVLKGNISFWELQSFLVYRIRISASLRKHAYSNILKIFPPKNENFQIKNSNIFHISAQNIDCWYSLEPPRRGGCNEYPQSMFWAEIRKIMYTPVNPSFTV